MKKLKNYILSNTDKIFLHYPIAFLLASNTYMNKWQATIFAIIICILKELYDKYVKKTYISIGDLIWDYAGIITAIVLRLYLNV